MTLTITGSSDHPSLALTVTNSGPSKVTARSRLEKARFRFSRSDPGRCPGLTYDPFVQGHGWYDLTLTLEQNAVYARQYAGHLENGKPSITG